MVAIGRGAYLPYFGKRDDYLAYSPREQKRRTIQGFPAVSDRAYSETEPVSGFFYLRYYYLKIRDYALKIRDHTISFSGSEQGIPSEKGEYLTLSAPLPFSGTPALFSSSCTFQQFLHFPELLPFFTTVIPAHR